MLLPSGPWRAEPKDREVPMTGAWLAPPLLNPLLYMPHSQTCTMPHQRDATPYLQPKLCLMFKYKLCYFYLPQCLICN